METGLIEEFTLAGSTYPFSLCHKSEDFGAVPVNHWWMPVTELYAQRQQRRAVTGNHLAISDFYWAMCRDHGATSERDAQERYLLARLLPTVRSQGSRNIFADPFLAGGTARDRCDRVAELELLLGSSVRDEMTRAQFHERTLTLLGRPAYPQGTQDVYDSLASQLLDEACLVLGRGQTAEALAMVNNQWQQHQKRIGRRAGKAEAKLVLDVLSYEARAAFHQCYSVAWCALLPRLRDTNRISEADFHFLRLWHLDNVDSGAADRGECLSLFHGHIFSLHPGTGGFLQTSTGRTLMGAFITEPDSATNFHRVLHGLLVTLHQYALRREAASGDRRKRVTLEGRDDLVAEEEIQAERKAGRRRCKSPNPST